MSLKTKKKQQRGQLFSNNRPETTIHGYGFDTIEHVNATLADLINRDAHYQFQVVNTLYNRAKVMSPIKYKAQLKLMATWLKKYKSQAPQHFDYLAINIVNKLEAFANYYNISRKARGLEKPTTSDKGFLPVYREIKGDYAKLRTMPVKASKLDGQTWDKQRNNYLVRRVHMLKNAGYGLYTETGLPTILHVNMMMWAYSPDPAMKNIKHVNKLLSLLK
jgi:hypothetical protein